MKTSSPRISALPKPVMKLGLGLPALTQLSNGVWSEISVDS
jgi:hypothetical protein